MTKRELVDKLVANGSISEEEAEALRPKEAVLRCKVTEKGGISVYGLQRFPVTLYANQWERLIESIPALVAFIAENEDKLARK